MTGHPAIAHATYLCEPCAASGTPPVYHFGRSDGHTVTIAHGCEHYIRDCYPASPPPADWLAAHRVTTTEEPRSPRPSP